MGGYTQQLPPSYFARHNHPMPHLMRKDAIEQNVHGIHSCFSVVFGFLWVLGSNLQ